MAADTADRLRALERENALLRAELGHRVGNSLQAVGGLLRARLRAIPDPAAAAELDEFASRLAVYGRAHAHAVVSARGTHLPVGRVLDDVIDHLCRRLGCPRAAVRLIGLELPLDVATDVGLPFVLVVHDLVAEALRTRSPDQVITVAVHQTRDTARVVVDCPAGRTTTAACPGGPLEAPLLAALARQAGASLTTEGDRLFLMLPVMRP